MKLKTLLTPTLLIAVTAGTAKEYRRAGNAVSFRKAQIEVLSPTMFSMRKGDNYRFAPMRIDLGITELPTAPVMFDITKEEAYRIATREVTIVYDPAQPLTAGGIRVEGTASVPELGAEDTQNLGGVIGALDNCDGKKCYSEQNDITSSHDVRPTPQGGILCRRTLPTYDCSGGARLTVEAPRSTYPEAVAERTYNIEIVGTPKPAQVTVNGRTCDDWTWYDDLLTARCGTFATTQPVTIEIR